MPGGAASVDELVESKAAASALSTTINFRSARGAESGAALLQRSKTAPPNGIGAEGETSVVRSRDLGVT